MWPRLFLASRVLLRSQGGPIADLPFTRGDSALPFRCPAVPNPLVATLLVQHPSSLNVRVQDMDLGRPNVLDNHRLEIVANVPLLCPLAVDTTIVSVLKRDGSVRTRCATVDGASLEAARRRKEATYPELTGRNGRTKLVVLGCEVGVRLSGEQEFLRSLAKAKARIDPGHLRTTVCQAWCLRWVVLLACSATKAVALSLLERPGGLGSNGAIPTTSEVIGEARYTSSSLLKNMQRRKMNCSPTLQVAC